VTQPNTRFCGRTPQFGKIQFLSLCWTPPETTRAEIQKDNFVSSIIHQQHEIDSLYLTAEDRKPSLRVF